MAQRDREKSAKRVTPAAALRSKDAAAAPAAAEHRLEAKIKALEKERDGLKAELEAARLRIAALDQSRRQAADRIEWIIDSLNGLVDKDA